MLRNLALMFNSVVKDLLTFFFGAISGLRKGSEYDFCIPEYAAVSGSLGIWYLYSLMTFSSVGSYLYSTE